MTAISLGLVSGANLPYLDTENNHSQAKPSRRPAMAGKKLSMKLVLIEQTTFWRRRRCEQNEAACITGTNVASDKERIEMTTERENDDQSRYETESTEITQPEYHNQLAEISGLSLEDRMAAADQMGIPVSDGSNNVSIETVSSADNFSEDLTEQQEPDEAGDETDH